MKKNIGSTDKWFRVLAAIIIMALSYFDVINGALEMVLLVVGIIFLLTALVNRCLLYSILGINSCKKD